MANTKTHIPRNYIFDFDGTIADSLPAFIAIFNKTIRGNTSPLTPDEIQAFRGMTSRQAIRMAGVRWWQVPKLLMQAMPDFHALAAELEPFPDMPKVIKQLHARGDKLFIVTSNTRDSVDLFLRAHKLEGYFEDIVTSASVFNKARSIRCLIARNRLKRRSCYYIGDETRDVRAARLAFIKVASVSWGFNTPEILRKQRPTKLIHEPKEILTLFEKEVS